ncbi:hypothetical protein C1H46_044446 [Malus baccata]|uniref:Dymeclin n=1 Tax=Malus baccata TaxID=106549 RepID=A0A540K719_MALBA|nr:hypothetical protein C1H46_044446 [Malus baccata]
MQSYSLQSHEKRSAQGFLMPPPYPNRQETNIALVTPRNEFISQSRHLLRRHQIRGCKLLQTSWMSISSSVAPTTGQFRLPLCPVAESSLVLSVVRRLLLSYITGPSISLNTSSYSVYSEGSQPGVLQRVGSAAANFMLLPFKILVSSSGEGSRSLLADSSLHMLLILIHYRKCVVGNEPITDKSNDTTASDSLLKGSTHFSDNPYCKVLEHATDVEFDRADTEGNAHIGPVLRLPFATLFDAFGM